MRQRDDPKIQAVRWFLEFLSEDFKTMSEVDLSRKMLEAQHYLIQSEQVVLRRDFIQDIRKRPKHYLGRDRLKHIQSSLRGFLEKRITSPTSLFPVSKVDFLFGTLDGTLKVKYSLDDYLLDTKKDPSKLAHIAELSLSLAVDGIPLEAIRICPECGRHFFHLSKKPRYYCSPTCTSRAISRRRRQANPEGYRARQREIMRKKYREGAKKIGKPTKG